MTLYWMAWQPSAVPRCLWVQDPSGWCSTVGDVETFSSIPFFKRKPGGLRGARDSEHHFSSARALILFCSEPVPPPRGWRVIKDLQTALLYFPWYAALRNITLESSIPVLRQKRSFTYAFFQNQIHFCLWISQRFYSPRQMRQFI